MTKLNLQRSTGAGLHVRHEKAGLILDSLPIPWNADAVIVEANVRLPSSASYAKDQFTLQFSDNAPTAWAEVLMPSPKNGPLRVFFRLLVPAKTCTAQFYWREHRLGQIDLPIVSAADYVNGFSIDLTSLQATIGERTAACRSFVSAQVKALFASAVLRAQHPLASAIDLDLAVEVRRADGERIGRVEVALTAEQRRLRQALTTVLLPKPRNVGNYEVSWHLRDKILLRVPFEIVSKKTLANSPRISATRFIVRHTDGTQQNVRALPTRDGLLILDGISEVAPVFFVCSHKTGLAGIVPFALRILVGDLLSTIGIDEKVLITDGPTPIVLGTVSADALSRTKHFSLASGTKTLGNLAVLPAPATDFTGEGGFEPTDDFVWTAAAEEQLNERLGKLLGDA
ncbi:MAG: hypothetical protein FJ303_15185 [Planctomycetes bacterium]|nr:hypothetical protein [Planctomycetota bacterium]